MVNEPVPLSDPLKATMARIAEKRAKLSVEAEAVTVVEELRALPRVEPRGIEADAQAAAQEVKDVLFPGRKPPAEQGRLPFAPLPSDLARCSPFFPMDKKSLSVRPYADEILITKGPWGTITFSGKKLSTLEESALLAILAAIDGQREKQLEDVGKRMANAYTGPILPLLKLMGITGGKANYERFLESLNLLQGCRIKIETKDTVYSVGSPVAFYCHDKDSKAIKIVLSPYFLEMFAAGRVALLDVLRRAALPGEISKALFRFVESHRGREWTGHFLTLSAALNMDVDQPHFRLREQIKKALAALKKARVIGPRSCLKGDVVYIRPPAPEKPQEQAISAKKKSLETKTT